MKDLVAESAIMKTFHHPNVLPLLGVCIDYDDEDVLKIVMPFMANGDLRTYLKDSRVSPNNTQEYPEVCNTSFCISTYIAATYIETKWSLHLALGILFILKLTFCDFVSKNSEYACECILTQYLCSQF